MKIFHVITDLQDGGAEAVLYRLVLSQSQHIHEVVCLGSGGKYVSLLRAEGVRVHILNLRSSPFAVVNALRLFSIIRKFKPDTIQGWMYHGNFVSALCGCVFLKTPVYWGVHHTNLIVGVDPFLTRLLSKVCALFSHFIPKAVIYCGDKSREVHIGAGYSRSRAVVVRNGYDTEKFTPNSQSRQAVRADLDIDENSFVIGCVGRYAPQKDHANLLEGVRHLADKGQIVDVLLVGTDLDASNEELKRKLELLNLPGKVYLLGRQENVASIMNAVDLHVTSSAFGEAFPNVICEAMSCGVPCVTTDVGDAAYIVDGSGWVVSPSSPVELGEAIGQAVDRSKNESIWLERKVSARERIKANFGVDVMSEKYLQVWGEKACYL